MAIYKYAATHAATNTVREAGTFDESVAGMTFAAFVTAYAAANSGWVIVDTGASAFPAGMGWASETFSDPVRYGYVPGATGLQSIADIKLATLAIITDKTERIEFTGSFLYDGKPFARSHSARDGIGLLAALTNINPTIAAKLLPYKVVSNNGDVVTISTAADALAFATPILEFSRDVSAAQAAQVSALMGLNNIAQVVQYVDTR